MNKINVEKVIDYTKVLKDNEVLQDMDKILRNENTNLKLEIERLNNIINELEKYLEKIIIDGGTRGSMTFWYRQIYDYLQELKGSDKE